MIIKKIADDDFDDIKDSARRDNKCLIVLLPVVFLANGAKIRNKHNNLRSTYVDYNKKILDERFIPCIDYQGKIDNSAVKESISNLPEDKKLYFEIPRQHYKDDLLQILERNKRSFVIVMK